MNPRLALARLCVFLALFALCACSAKISRDAPRILPQEYKISVAPFTQPIDPSQLIAGTLPEEQGKISEEDLLALNADLRDVLMKNTERTYNFIQPTQIPPDWTKARSSAQPSGLRSWLDYGKKRGTHYLLVPQIIDWSERQGSDAGVVDSAHVRLEFYLLNIDEGRVVNRAIFEEKQVGLVDDLLSVGDFVKRGGKWLTARELTDDGMAKAARDLGL